MDSIEKAPRFSSMEVDAALTLAVSIDPDHSLNASKNGFYFEFVEFASDFSPISMKDQSFNKCSFATINLRSHRGSQPRRIRACCLSHNKRVIGLANLLWDFASVNETVSHPLIAAFD